MSKSGPGYMPTLDGWRAVAALTVLGSHICSSNPALPQPVREFASIAGWNAVSLFFGISGLLITSRLLEEQDVRGKISLRGFYLRRACRIIPAAWLYLAVVAALAWLGFIATSSQGLFSAGLFYRNYLYRASDWYTGHFWSLAIEEHFYLTWPGMLVVLGKRRAAWAAGFLCLAIFVWRLLDGFDAGIMSRFDSPQWYRTDGRLDALLFPSLLAILLQRAEFVHHLRARLTPKWWLRLAGVAALTIAAPEFPPILRSCLLSLQAALIPVLIAGVMLNPGCRLGRALESSALRWTGRISYSLYLWQQLILSRLAVAVLWRLIACTGCAAASFYFVERPFVRLGHRLAPPATPGRLDLDELAEREPVRAAALG